MLVTRSLLGWVVIEVRLSHAKESGCGEWLTLAVLQDFKLGGRTGLRSHLGVRSQG